MSIFQGGNLIAGSGGGVSNIDNLTITENANEEIQTVGVINSRDSSTAVKTWTGTKAQYDAIVTKDPNTLYNITDDTDVSLTILEALYPVGSVYITTANTCPLSALISGSTWELVSQDRVLQGADNDHSAGTTIEAGLPKTSISIPTTGSGDNNGQWHRATLINNGGSLTRGGLNNDNWQVQTLETNTSSIYGNSTTVQPPAYVVNIYRRTA